MTLFQTFQEPHYTKNLVLTAYSTAHVTRLISQRKKRPTENDSTQHEKAVSSLGALCPVPCRNWTPIKELGLLADVEDSRRGVALRYLSKNQLLYDQIHFWSETYRGRWYQLQASERCGIILLVAQIKPHSRFFARILKLCDLKNFKKRTCCAQPIEYTGQNTTSKARRNVEQLSWQYRNYLFWVFSDVLYPALCDFHSFTLPVKHTTLNSTTESWNLLSRRQRSRFTRELESTDPLLSPIPRFHLMTEKPRETGIWVLVRKYTGSSLTQEHTGYLTAIFVTWERVPLTEQWRLLPDRRRCR